MAATTTVALAVAYAIAGGWVFGGVSGKQGSIWRLLIADRSVLGFLRVSLVALSLYAAASVAALIASGRWIRALSTTGVEVDDPARVDDRIGELQRELAQLREERDRAYRLLEDILGG